MTGTNPDQGFSADVVRATWNLQDALKRNGSTGPHALRQARDLRRILQTAGAVDHSATPRQLARALNSMAEVIDGALR